MEIIRDETFDYGEILKLRNHTQKTYIELHNNNNDDSYNIDYYES